MTTSNVELKEIIMTKLNDADLSEEKKEKIRKLNDSIGGSHSELLRKLLLAVVDKETDFRENLVNIGTVAESSDGESSDDERVVEQIIELYESFTFSCITKDDVRHLNILLYYCNTGNSFFRRTFEMICCIGHVNCLNVALKRIFGDPPNIDENFMEGEPAKTLFDANFYRRIVEHNRVALIEETLFQYWKKANWKKDVMKELAENGKYTKVAEYLRDPDSHRTISDPRKELDYTERVELANRLQEAVKNKEIVKLEQHLQDLEGYKKEYSNLDNLINETVSSEGGIWKNEKLIHWACRQGDLAICKALYDKGASLRVLDNNFHSPAHVAVKKNHLHVLKWLNKCDDTLIKSFSENGWTDPLLKDMHLFKLEKNNVNLPILEYLLSLGCDSLLKEENIDQVLNQAIDDCNGDYSCIEILIEKGKEFAKCITAEQLKKAASRQDQAPKLATKLLSAASRACINTIYENDKKFLEELYKKCPDALPDVISKFKKFKDHIDVPAEEKKRIEIKKSIFEEIVKYSKEKNDANLLLNKNVKDYIDCSFNINKCYMLPYYLDIVCVCIHLFLFSLYCIYDICYICVLCISILLISIRVVQLIRFRKFCKGIVKTCFYAFAIIVLSFIIYVEWNRTYEGWGQPLIILCLLFSWANLMMKIKVLPCDTGLYIEIFGSILKRCKGILGMFAMFLICFSTILFLLFKDKDQFAEGHSTVLKTLAMVTGELDFNELFKQDNTTTTATTFNPSNATTTFTTDYTTMSTPNTSSTTAIKKWLSNEIQSIIDYIRNHHRFLRYYVFFIFIIVQVLFLNLLTGVAVEDVDKMLKDSKDRQHIRQAELMLELQIFWEIYDRGIWKNLKALIKWICTKWNCISLTISNCWERMRRRVRMYSRNRNNNNGNEMELEAQNNHFLLGNGEKQATATDSSSTRPPPKNEEEQATATESPPVTMDDLMREISQLKKKQQEEYDQTNRTLDLMKEVIFQMEKQNREMDKRTKEILDRLPSSTVRVTASTQTDGRETLKELSETYE